MKTVILMINFFLWQVAVEGESCGSLQSANYKGRVFNDYGIGSEMNPINRYKLEFVYLCRAACHRESACVAISYKTAIGYCALFNATRVTDYFEYSEGNKVILLLPKRCKENSTVDGQWSENSEIGPCSKTCTKGGNINFNRTCTKPEPDCNGHGCVGVASGRHKCNAADCPAYEISILSSTDPSDRFSEFSINGKLYTELKRGINLLQLNSSSGLVSDVHSIDLHGDLFGNAKLENYIHNIIDGQVVLAAVKDKANFFTSQQASGLQYEIIGAVDAVIGNSDSFCLIGCKSCVTRFDYVQKIGRGQSKSACHSILPEGVI